MSDSTRKPAGGASSPPPRCASDGSREWAASARGVPGADAPPAATLDDGIVSSQEEEQQQAAAPADHEAEVEIDLEQLSAKAQKADEYLELAQRTKADFENYRKRAAREAGAAQERGVVRLTRELLPAVDNLDRALGAVKNATDGGDLLAGVKLVHAEVLAALARVGVEPFDPEGEPFDPSCHEAVAQQPVEGAQAGTVAEVYQRGYRLGETVIRPARVLVAG